MGSSGFCPDTNEMVVSSLNKFDISNTSTINVNEDNGPRLWLGCREGEGIFTMLA